MNKTFKTTLLTAALGAAIMIPAAHSAPHGGGKGERGAKFFEQYDANNDRAVSAQELQSGRDAKLERFDADGDGKLTLKEYEALWLERMRERMVDSFQRLDADGDAQVTATEFARPGDRRFMWMDRDNDGQVTMEEMRQMRQMRKMRKMRGAGHERGERREQHHGMRHGRGHQVNYNSN